MYAYMIGKVAEANADSCVLDVNNIGYNIQIPASTAEKLPPDGQEVKLFTYTSVRENAIELIGFISRDDLNIFSMLITVSGIGPKAALSLLSYISADEIRVAIVTGDVKTLSRAPGLGKKSAERIIVDLKNKFDANTVLAAASGVGTSSAADAADSSMNEDLAEAVEALCALGLARSDAKKAVLSIENAEDMSIDDIISAALKVI